MIMKTFLTVFPDVNVYSGIKYPGVIMIGRPGQQPIDTMRFKNAENNVSVMNDLNEWGPLFKSPLNMLDLLMFNKQDLEKIVEHDKVISDNHPYTEFPLWRLKFDPEERTVFNVFKLRKINTDTTVVSK